MNFAVLHSVAGRYLHSPEACSLASGWIAERLEVREVTWSNEDDTIPVHLWVMRRGEERVMVAFWYLIDGRPVRGSIGHHLGATWQRLKYGSTDSAFVELSVQLPGRKDSDLFALAGALHSQVRKALWK